MKKKIKVYIGVDQNGNVRIYNKKPLWNEEFKIYFVKGETALEAGTLMTHAGMCWSYDIIPKQIKPKKIKKDR